MMKKLISLILLLSASLLSSLAFSLDIIFDEPQKLAIEALSVNNIDKAHEHADMSKRSNLMHDIVNFVEMTRSQNTDIQDWTALIHKYHWLAKLLPNKFDKAMNVDLSYQEIKNYYDLLPQKTALSHFFLYDAAIRENLQKEDSLKKLELLWTKSTFSSDIERYLTLNYIELFQVTAIESKIRTLLMNKKLDDAKNLINFLPSNKKSTYEDLIKASKAQDLARKMFYNKTATPSVKMVALYFYIKHLNQAKEYQKTYDLLLKANYNDFAAAWWQMKNIAIRNALKEKKYQTALQLAKSNQIKEGPDFFESQWLAGFVTFRMLQNPRDSLDHFHNIFNTAKTSHSKAQGAYWLGRAYKAIGNTKKSNQWYHLAVTKYPHFFYGQLASLEIDKKLEYNNASNAKKSSINKLTAHKEIEEMIIWAKSLYKCGFKTDATKLANYILDFDYLNDNEIVTVLEQLEELPVIVAASKQLANAGYPLIKASYPIHPDVIKNDTKHPHSLYLSIIRQESSFDHQALSPAGARGLMQLMPQTAEKYAKYLGLQKNDYNCDASTNISIGVCYVDKLMELWNNNYIMAIASYNAGENAVARWINEYGDPRASRTLHQSLDWLELMPYGETRLYVKKVLENITNYNLAIHNKPYAPNKILELFDVSRVH